MGFKRLPDHEWKIHCSINLLLFIEAVWGAEPGGRGAPRVSHLSKQERGQILEDELSTNYD